MHCPSRCRRSQKSFWSRHWSHKRHRQNWPGTSPSLRHHLWSLTNCPNPWPSVPPERPRRKPVVTGSWRDRGGSCRDLRQSFLPREKSPLPRSPACSPLHYAAGGSGDRKSVVEGKSVSVRVDLVGRRIPKKKIKIRDHKILIT